VDSDTCQLRQGLNSHFNIAAKGLHWVLTVHRTQQINVTMDNLHYRLIFDLGKSTQKNSRNEPFKSSKISKFGHEIL
jgi:hypothetical protein